MRASVFTSRGASRRGGPREAIVRSASTFEARRDAVVSAFREAKRLEHERAREGWTVGFGKTMAKVLHRRGLCVEVPPRALAAAAHIMLDRAGETAAERKREGWQGDLGYVLGAKLDQALAELGYARAPAERWGR